MKRRYKSAHYDQISKIIWKDPISYDIVTDQHLDSLNKFDSQLTIIMFIFDHLTKHIIWYFELGVRFLPIIWLCQWIFIIFTLKLCIHWQTTFMATQDSTTTLCRILLILVCRQPCTLHLQNFYMPLLRLYLHIYLLLHVLIHLIFRQT